MSIYAAANYRQAITERLKFLKNNGSRLTLSKLAEQCRIQRTYISHVLALRADFSLDQAFAVGRCLQWDREEIDFFELLVSEARCPDGERKQYLADKVERMRASQTVSEQTLKRPSTQLPLKDLTDYYADCYCSLVHMFLTIEAFARQPQKIRAHLNMSAPHFDQVMAVLVNCGLVERSEGGLETKDPNIHLRADSPLSRVHGANFRTYAIQHRLKSRNDRDYYFSATFSADDETRAFVHARFAELLKDLGQKCDTVKTRQVFHLNFDLFEI